MKRTTITAYVLFVSLTCSLKLIGQTIIDYENWTGASGYNIFYSATNTPTNNVDVSATMNGTTSTIAHRSTIGQPEYSTTNKAAYLRCYAIVDGNGNTIGYKGTEYRIAFNFKSNFRYKIVINAACIKASSSGTFANLRLLPNSGGSSISNQCNGPNDIDQNTSGGLYTTNSMTNGATFQNYEYTYNAFTSTQSYLNIAAVPPIGSGNQEILIRKITITETAPAASFTLSPATVNATCGSSVTQTYTITNVNNTPGVTYYTWNLGSANNGWLYNGSPALQTITTTTNTLTLTSATCSSVLSNVSATAHTSSTTYNTNVSSSSIVQPFLMIDGANAVCSTETYVINNLPCSATVSWDASPSGIVTTSTNGSQVTVTRIANGTITLTATIANACGRSFPLQKNNISVTTAPTGIAISQYSNLQMCNSDTYFQVLSASGFYPYSGSLTVAEHNSVANVTWTLSPFSSGTDWQWEASGSSVTVSTKKNNLTLGLRATATNACGSTYRDYTFNSGECVGIEAIGGGEVESYSLSPNPTTGALSVSLTKKDPSASIEEIIIKNKVGAVIRRQKFSDKSRSRTLHLQDLPTDVYLIQLFDGKQWQSAKIIKQ